MICTTDKTCHKCCIFGGLLLLALGVLFLLRDVGVWDFWNIQWWTALLLFLGLTAVGHSFCGPCQDLAKKK